MNLNLKQLEAFVWVSDLGSFRKAATRLNTTQPNISARIAALESILKVTLMERDAGSVRLTSKGESLLAYARKALRTTEDLIEAADQKSLFEGVLKLGVTEMIVHTWLRHFLKVLKEKFPNIDVELTVDISVNIEKELFDRSIDLAFQNEPFIHQTTGSIDLGTYPVVWVASPDLGLHELAQVRVKDLCKHPILTHARHTQLFQMVEKHLVGQRDISPRIVPSSNLSASIHMAIDGLGIAILPAAMVANEMAAGELVKLDYAWQPESLHFLARYNAGKASGVVSSAAALASEVAVGYTAGFNKGSTWIK